MSSSRNGVSSKFSKKRVSQKKLKYCKRSITLINCEILTGKREKCNLREVNKVKTKYI